MRIANSVQEIEIETQFNKNRYLPNLLPFYVFDNTLSEKILSSDQVVNYLSNFENRTDTIQLIDYEGNDPIIKNEEYATVLKNIFDTDTVTLKIFSQPKAENEQSILDPGYFRFNIINKSQNTFSKDFNVESKFDLIVEHYPNLICNIKFDNVEEFLFSDITKIDITKLFVESESFSVLKNLMPKKTDDNNKKYKNTFTNSLLVNKLLTKIFTKNISEKNKTDFSNTIGFSTNYITFNDLYSTNYSVNNANSIIRKFSEINPNTNFKDLDVKVINDIDAITSLKDDFKKEKIIKEYFSFFTKLKSNYESKAEISCKSDCEIQIEYKSALENASYSEIVPEFSYDYLLDVKTINASDFSKILPNKKNVFLYSDQQDLYKMRSWYRDRKNTKISDYISKIFYDEENQIINLELDLLVLTSFSFKEDFYVGDGFILTDYFFENKNNLDIFLNTPALYLEIINGREKNKDELYKLDEEIISINEFSTENAEEDSIKELLQKINIIDEIYNFEVQKQKIRYTLPVQKLLYCFEFTFSNFKTDLNKFASFYDRKILFNNVDEANQYFPKITYNFTEDNINFENKQVSEVQLIEKYFTKFLLNTKSTNDSISNLQFSDDSVRILQNNINQQETFDITGKPIGEVVEQNVIEESGLNISLMKENVQTTSLDVQLWAKEDKSILEENSLLDSKILRVTELSKTAGRRLNIQPRLMLIIQYAFMLTREKYPSLSHVSLFSLSDIPLYIYAQHIASLWPDSYSEFIGGKLVLQDIPKRSIHDRIRRQLYNKKNNVSGGKLSYTPKRKYFSTRHDNGFACDVNLYAKDSSGRSRVLKLNSNQSNSFKIFLTFMKYCKILGASGIGAGTNYSTDGKMIHVDIARSNPEFDKDGAYLRNKEIIEKVVNNHPKRYKKESPFVLNLNVYNAEFLLWGGKDHSSRQTETWLKNLRIKNETILEEKISEQTSDDNIEFITTV